MNPHYPQVALRAGHRCEYCHAPEAVFNLPLEAAQYAVRLPEHLERLTWSQERVQAERTRGLRTLLRVAKEYSPWHRERLAHLDPSRVTEADLATIPPMTKDDLMRHFDAILATRDVSRDHAEAHLDGLIGGAYLRGHYHVVASGGSSGVRGVFLFDWEGWLLCALTQQRFRARARAHLGITPDAVSAVVAGGKATHMSYAISQTFGRNLVSVSATLPIREMVARLNALQPVVLGGYPSILFALASEASAGRLSVHPRLVMCGSEPLLPEMRHRIEDVWSVRAMNGYFTSEGASASDCGIGRGMHLNEDVCIFEPVDVEGRPVVAGQRTAKVYVTPLFNHVQPLIRYELTDEVTLRDDVCPCGSAMRRIDDIEGRNDDLFTYAGGVIVHPMAFRSPLGRERSVIEYQVRQTAHGAAIALRSTGQVDLEALRRAVEHELRTLGVLEPQITIHVVEGFDRHATGKLKRFFPLEAQTPAG
jgi:phenylacetate-coenzyme A ligase PaaK-like adenylate-forming protein